MMNEETEKDIDVLEKTLLPQPEPPLVNDIICRLCANPNDRIIGIYSEEGLSNELSYKMNLYLPIKVHENDTLPLQCCWNCASTVLAWHELVVLSVEADHRLRSILQANDQPNEIYENFDEATSPFLQDEKFELKPPAAGLNVFCQEPTIDIVQPKNVSPVKRKHQANNIKKQYLVQCNVLADESLLKYLENIQNPILETGISADSLIRLNKADDTYTSIENSDCSSLIISYPLKSQSSGMLEETDNSNAESSSTIVKKSVIDPLKISLENISDVIKEEYNFSCQFCTSMFVNEDDILDHVKTKHANKHLEEDSITLTTASRKKKLRCRKLDQNVINAAKVVIEGRAYYTCKICGKILHSPYTYIWHIRIHTGERPYVCDLCGKQFRISQGLVRHVKETHQGVKNFGCDICGRMFATRRNVQEHRRIHTNERPYICDLCGKSFKQKASLFVHNRSHSNLYPFTCTYCNQGFRTRPPLLIHMTRHTGEKPYPCDICGRFFRIKYELKRHKLIHSEEKPYSCAECGLHFRQKRYLKNHNKTSHKQITVQV